MQQQPHAHGSSTLDNCRSSKAAGALGDDGSSNSRDGSRSKQTHGSASREEATDQEKKSSNTLQQTA